MKDSTELKRLTNTQLHLNTKQLAAEERRITADVIDHLREIENRRLYAELGYSSLFKYCMKELGYSETSANRRIAAVNLGREVPELNDKIISGELNLTNVVQAQVFFNAEAKQNGKSIAAELKRSVLSEIENKSTRDAEKKLFELMPQHNIKPTQKRERRISSEQTEIKIILSEDTKAKIERVNNLLSHKHSSLTNDELLIELLDLALQKLDPELKFRRQLKRPSSQQTTKPDSILRRAAKPAPDVAENNLVKAEPTSTMERDSAQRTNPHYISASLKYETWMKYQGRCSYQNQDTGEACRSRHKLEYDHILPLAVGGKTEAGNLRLLCRTHNQLAAIQKLGKPLMQKYLHGLT